MRILISIFVLSVFIVNLAHADLGDLDAIVVETSRSNDTVGSMNKDVNIITSQDIANSPAKDLPALLNTIPGVHIAVNSNIKYQQIDIGGFGGTGLSNVLVLVDGMRLNMPDLSGADLSLIDINSIDHIEVIQGASTVLYGDNAAGGIINIVTKKGIENTKPTVTLTSEVDSYKGNKDGVELSGGLPKLSYQFNYDRQQSDNYRTYDNYWANDYDTRLNYNSTDIFGIDLAQGYHLDRYRKPGGLTINDIDSVGRRGTSSPDVLSNATTSDSHFDVTPHMKFDAGNSNIDLSLFSSARKRETNVDYPNGYLAGSIDYETESYEYQPKAIISTPLTDSLANKLTSGYDYIYNKEERRSYSIGNPEDVFYSNEASHNVYLLDELTLDERWLFSTGVRGAWADYVFNQTQQSAVKFERSATTEGYDGGLGYKYNPDSKVFVDCSHSYRLPVLDEFFQVPYESGGIEHSANVNSGLTYQKGNQYQLGIKDRSFKNINLGFTATEAQYKNEIFFDPNALSVGNGANVNYNGRTRHYSQEAEASVELFNRKIEPFANITFQQSEFVKGNYSGNTIPFVPDHLANAGVTFRPLERLSTSFTTHFVGKAFLDSDQANTEPKLKRYDTVDWNAKYGFRNVEIWVTLQNIFNTKYYSYGDAYGFGYDVYYPAPGRNIAAGVKVRF